MKPIKFLVFLSLFFFCFLCCNNNVRENTQVTTPIKTQEPIEYQDQIGDTPFDKSVDNPAFKFCDSSNVIHKRAWVTYEDGVRGLDKDILNNYVFKSSYQNHSGYFVIRFVVNCNDETGRFRMESLDENMKLANCPTGLENHILYIAKGLKGWKHAFFDNRHADSYRFFTIKMINGKIQPS